jgi:hypothetical protein
MGRPAKVLNVGDPFAMTIATNVATKIADTLADQAQQAVVAIVRKIREKLRSRRGGPADPAAEVATLDAAIATSDTAAAEALARLLEQLFAADPEFRAEIRALWDSAELDDRVTNVFYGKADKVIMMRDVKGDLTIN